MNYLGACGWIPKAVPMAVDVRAFHISKAALGLAGITEKKIVQLN